MTLGCVYCSYSGWDLFREAYAAIEVSPDLGGQLTVASCGGGICPQGTGLVGTFILGA